MSGQPQHPPLQWLEADTPFPAVATAWGADTGAPGLLAAGGGLAVERLTSAYAQGIFPWFSQGQPVLWWSPTPRMVLQTGQFKMHRSLAKTLQRHHLNPAFSLCFDRAFDQVIEHCAHSPRKHQNGTWIVPSMVQAYQALHRAGHAHSAEVWLEGQLVAGLYFVCLGKAVFGESMFTLISDGSKMALSALVYVCRLHGIDQIDCQQNTSHLASLGATEVPRAEFLQRMALNQTQTSPDWQAQSVDALQLAHMERLS